MKIDNILVKCVNGEIPLAKVYKALNSICIGPYC